MMPPAKQMDPVLGVDIHIIQPPGPVPPVPIPHPFVGMVLDPMEFAPIIGATVKIHGMPAAIAGVECKCIPPHIPMGGAWVPPPPGNEGELFMGSSTVSFDGDAASHLLHPALTCQSVGMPKPPRPNPKKKPKPKASLMLPTSMVLPIPGGPPVFIGGPPTISLMAMGMKLGMAALGKAFKKFSKSNIAKKLKNKFKKARQKMFKNMKPGFLKCKILKAEPVNAVTGEVVVEQSDFTIDGHIPIEWGRLYGSQSRYWGACGYGWQTPADIRLEIDTDDQALFYDGTPGVTVFPEIPIDPHPPGERFPDPPPAKNYVMELQNGARLYLDGGRFEVRTKEGRIYRFEAPESDLSSYRKISVVMRVEEIADEYDNYLRFVRNTWGELVKIEESAGRTIIVKSHRGLIREMAFSHPDEDGHLRPLVRYEYDKVGNLIAVFDALGKPYRFAYQDGKLARHMDRNGLSFYYEYDHTGFNAKCIHAWGDGGLYDYHFEYEDFTTTIVNSLGHQSFLQYTPYFLPISEFDSLGPIANYEYDEEGRTTAVIDGIKRRTEYAYDDLGNLTKLTRADGTSISIEFDEWSNPVKITDPNGNEWRQEWSEKHRLITQITPLGHETNYFYGLFGELESIIDPRRFQSYVKLTPYGHLAAFIDPLGNITRFETDVFGNIVREVSPGKRETRYKYDAKFRLVIIVNPSGTKIDCAYDAEDNLTHYRDEAGHIIQLVYQGLGEVSKRVNPDGTTVQYERDTEEQLIAVVNERGQKYQLIRDPRGRIIEEIDYWGKSRTYTYDRRDNLLKSKDPLGRVTVFQNDQLGRLKSKTLFDGKIETFEYDANGNLNAHENEHIRCERQFDQENRLIEETQGAFRVESEYDEVGNRVRRRSSHGNDIYFEYDSNNQVITVQINDEPQFQIRRDKDGFAANEIMGGHLERDYEYNPDGLLTRQHYHQNGFSYFERKYEYDPVGNLTAKIDSDKGRVGFTYDPMGRVVKSINPRNHVEEFLYDSAGELLKSDHLYDPDTDLRKSTFKDINYYFDAAGNLVERSSNEKQTTFEWDGSNRLVKAETDDQITELGYDAQGRRLYKETGTSRTTFAWDGDQLLSDKLNVTGWGAREFVYYPGTFEPLAMINKDHKVYYYQNDAVGLPQELCSTNGMIVWSAEYEAFGEVRKLHKNSIENPLRFQGQYYDKELDINYNRFRYFDPVTKAFLSRDPLGLVPGPNIYLYAPNVWTWVDPFGLTCTKASDLPVIKRGTKEWDEAVASLKKGGKTNIRVESATDAKALLKEARGNMDRRKRYTTQKYKKGSEMHPSESHTVNAPHNDLPHIKWKDWHAKDNPGVGHIFFDRPN